MKKLIWLALLLPTLALAEPATQSQLDNVQAHCVQNGPSPTTQNPIKSCMAVDHEARLGALEASGGDGLGQIPAACELGFWHKAPDGSNLYPDGKWWWMNPTTMYSLSEAFAYTYAVTTISISFSGTTQFLVKRFPDTGTAFDCLTGLIEAGRL